MIRGDLVRIALQGEFGKPRPALVMQADMFGDTATVTLLPLTGTLVPVPLLRVMVEPSAGNNLEKTSQVMIDKAVTVRREKAGPVFGRIEAEVMVQIERCLAVFLGIAR